MDDEERHDNVNGSHECSAQEETHPQHDRIFEHGSGCVVKMSEQREYPHAYDQPGNTCNDKHSGQDRPEGGRLVKTQQNKSVEDENRSGDGHDQADHSALFKV